MSEASRWFKISWTEVTGYEGVYEVRAPFGDVDAEEAVCEQADLIAAFTSVDERTIDAMVPAEDPSKDKEAEMNESQEAVRTRREHSNDIHAHL